MSQKTSRKGMVNEEKEKTDTPVKDMKKKMAANAEKEKQTAEKKEAEKPTEKNDKAAEKAEKAAEKAEKAAEKVDKAEKKTDKAAEKKEKSAEKKSDAPVEKKEDASKDDKSGKSDKTDQKKADRPKVNGKGASVNGTANGDENGTAKVTRTPETPRPASDKQPEKDAADDSKDSKVLKLKEDAPASTDRKLRSADSPKPEKKDKIQEKKAQESPRKHEGKEDGKDQEEKENGDKTEKEVEVVIEIDCADEEPRKTDTNYSKSRVKVSPYRRSVRLADQTASSVVANYTGNNTTMEMDITETTSSFTEDASLDDSSYLSGLRSIRGRRSYKPLKEMALRQAANRSQARPVTVGATEQPSRPTAPVVGRKRKPEADESIELGTEASESLTAAHTKRMRLLERLTHSFRRTASSTPLPARRAAEIVGINTDLPLSAPVAQAESFDPEALKPDAPIAVPLAPTAPVAATEGDRDNKRCVVM